jgi:hypothetical protein
MNLYIFRIFAKGGGEFRPVALFKEDHQLNKLNQAGVGKPPLNYGEYDWITFGLAT